MSTVPRLYTVDDLETFPDDGKRYEIIGGELAVSPAPSERHQRFQAELFGLIRNHVTSRKLGRAYSAPVDVRFSPLDQVQPDVIVLLNERRSNYKDSTVHGAPNLVIEVLSPGNRSYDQKVKFELYERNGVPEYWIADPSTNVVHQFVWRDGRYEEVTPVDGVLRSVAIPDLAIDLASFFEGLEW